MKLRFESTGFTPSAREYSGDRTTGRLVQRRGKDGALDPSGALA